MNIQVSTHGAELQSIIANRREYLWHGDPVYWKRRAPVLFPIVGRLKNDTLRIDGHEYAMPQHGFARDTEFEKRQGYYEMVSEECCENYPYLFNLAVRYATQGNTLNCEWQVTNRDDKTMHFQIGAHPAFLLPEYDEKDDIHGFIEFYDADNNMVSPVVLNRLEEGLRVPYGGLLTLKNGQTRITITNHTFACGAILLEGKQVVSAILLDKHESPVLTVRCSKADAFGIWAPYKLGCPFVCIEPWCGIADRYNFDGDISERDCNHSLTPGDTFIFSYSIQIH